MKKIILLLPILFFLVYSCAANQKNGNNGNELYTVKVVNTSSDKVLLRYQKDDLGYTFQFVDQKNEIKFMMNGNLTVQYSQLDFDDAKIIKIKQDTFIQVKENDILIDDLPASEKMIPVPKKIK